MLDKPKPRRQGRPWKNPQHVIKARLVYQDQTAARHLRNALAKKAETAARLKAIGGVPEEV